MYYNRTNIDIDICYIILEFNNIDDIVVYR